MQLIEQKPPGAIRVGRAKRLADYLTLANEPNATRFVDDLRAIVEERKEEFEGIDPAQRRRWIIGVFTAGTVAACVAAKYGSEFSMLSGRRPPLSTIPNRPKGFMWSAIKGMRRFIGPGPIDARTCAHVATVGLEAVRSDAYKQHRLPAGALALGLVVTNTLHAVEASDSAPTPGKRVAIRVGSDLMRLSPIVDEAGASIDTPAVQLTPVTIPEIIDVGQ